MNISKTIYTTYSFTNVTEKELNLLILGLDLVSTSKLYGDTNCRMANDLLNFFREKRNA